MFSPIVEIWLTNSSLTVLESSLIHFSSVNSSIVFELVLSTCSATFATNVLNFSFLETKSVSLLTSTIAAVLSSLTIAKTVPSAAIRPDFFSAVARPFFLSSSTALS